MFAVGYIVYSKPFSTLDKQPIVPLHITMHVRLPFTNTQVNRLGLSRAEAINIVGLY